MNKIIVNQGNRSSKKKDESTYKYSGEFARHKGRQSEIRDRLKKKELNESMEKQYKKKHHNHKKHRQATFSTDSQRQKIPSIKKLYFQDQVKPQKTSAQIQGLQYKSSKQQIFFPKGSILQLKRCKLQILTKQGRIDFLVEILTQQQHKYILQLFDPGFSSLCIDKDKNQNQIIEYLNAPKKKYKYLICWFEAAEINNDNLLKGISKEANEKQRIFGWQSDHVKMHIMSMKQFKCIKSFKCPNQCISDEKVIMIVQYPEKIYKVKSLYQPFFQISIKQQKYQQNIQQKPQPGLEETKCVSPSTITEALLQSTQKTLPEYFTQNLTQTDQTHQYKYPYVVYEGWAKEFCPPQFFATEQNQFIHNPNLQISNNLALTTPQQQFKQQQVGEIKNQLQPLAKPTESDQVQQIRLHFGFSQFQPILTDEEDDKEYKDGKKVKNLADELLGSIGNVDMASPPPIVYQQTELYGYNYYSYPVNHNYLIYQNPVNQNPNYPYFSPTANYPQGYQIAKPNFDSSYCSQYNPVGRYIPGYDSPNSLNHHYYKGYQ